MLADILGISELKWTGKGHFSLVRYKVYYSGHETKRLNGVAIMVAKKMVEAVQEYKPISDRIIYIQIRANPENLSITQVYAPTSEASEEVSNSFTNSCKM
jgi:exonuclease III